MPAPRTVIAFGAGENGRRRDGAREESGGPQEASVFSLDRASRLPVGVTYRRKITAPLFVGTINTRKPYGAATVDFIDWNGIDRVVEYALRFEEVLDRLHLYAYRNWLDGELVEGPVIGRHFVTMVFLWPENAMPDPAATRRLVYNGIRVGWQKVNRDVHDDVTSLDSIYSDPSESSGIAKPPTPLQTTPEPTSVGGGMVSISIPRRMVETAFGEGAPEPPPPEREPEEAPQR